MLCFSYFPFYETQLHKAKIWQRFQIYDSKPKFKKGMWKSNFQFLCIIFFLLTFIFTFPSYSSANTTSLHRQQTSTTSTTTTQTPTSTSTVPAVVTSTEGSVLLSFLESQGPQAVGFGVASLAYTALGRAKVVVMRSWHLSNILTNRIISTLTGLAKTWHLIFSLWLEWVVEGKGQQYVARIYYLEQFSSPR